jgi:hypothetical protein
VELLPIALVGWLYTVGAGLALAFGAWLIVGIHLRNPDARKQLAARVLDDALLFGIWILGLAGGIGVLLGKSWSRAVLELFCWTLMILVFLSAWSRWRVAAPPRGTLLLSLVLFVAPVVALCVATILTLRSEGALQRLNG